jgi:hypothetical protein
MDSSNIAVIVASSCSYLELKDLTRWIKVNSKRCHDLGIHFFIKDVEYSSKNSALFSNLKITTYFGCKDGGIYEAWNQAISVVPNNYNSIMFLGVSDRLKLETFEKIQNCYQLDKILISDYIEKRPDRKESYKFISGKLLCRFPKRPGFCFSSAIFPRSILSPTSFKKDYKIIGDFDWLLRNTQIDTKFQYFNHPLIEFETGGVSNAKETINKRMVEYKKSIKDAGFSRLHYYNYFVVSMIKSYWD